MRRLLLQQQDRLAIEPAQFRDHPEKRPGREVEGDDLVLADAIELTARSEPQPAGSGELHGGVRCQDADQPTGERVVFADCGPGARRAERPLAGNDEVAVGSDGQVQRAQLGIVNQPRIAEPAVAVEGGDGVITLPGGTYTGGQVQLAAIAESESSWERDGAVGQKQRAFGVESSWQRARIVPRRRKVTQ